MRLRSLSRVFRGIYISYALLAMTIGTVSWANTGGIADDRQDPQKPILTNADIETSIREVFRDSGIALSIKITNEGSGGKLVILQWGSAQIPVHFVASGNTFVLADGQDIRLLPIQAKQMQTSTANPEYATFSDYLDVFKYDWNRSEPAISFDKRTEFLANRMGAILFEQLKLRLESLGLRISNPDQVQNQLMHLVMEYQSSAFKNPEVKELTTAFLSLEKDMRVIEETLERLRQEFPSEFEQVLTKQNIKRLREICAPAVDIASDIRNNLWVIQYLHRTWVTEADFPVQVGRHRIEVNSETIRLHPWMFHELTTYYANRIVDLLDTIEKAPTINFKMSDRMVSDEFHPRDVFFGSLLPENPNAVKKLRAEVQRFSSRSWKKPILRPFARWAWERVRGKVRQMRGQFPWKGPLPPQAPSGTGEDLRGLGFSIYDHTDMMSRVRVNPDGSVIVEGESAVEATQRAFGEVVNRTAEIIGVRKATGEINRAEMSGGEVGNGRLTKFERMQRSFGIRKAK